MYTQLLVKQYKLIIIDIGFVEVLSLKSGAIFSVVDVMKCLGIVNKN